MGAFRYVVWTGKDRGETQRSMEIPVEGMTPQGPTRASTKVVFERDYTSGRLVWVGDTDMHPQEIAYFMNGADPAYFSVLDQPLPPDPEYTANLYRDGVDVTQFTVQLKRISDINKLKQMFAELHKNGVGPSFTIPLNTRIAELEESNRVLQERVNQLNAEGVMPGVPPAAVVPPPPAPVAPPEAKPTRRARQPQPQAAPA